MLDRMQLGMIGLGRMGANMVRRLIKGGHECVVFDRSPESVAELGKQGATGSSEICNKIRDKAIPFTRKELEKSILMFILEGYHTISMSRRDLDIASLLLNLGMSA